jgi:hypothetical protein
LNGDHGSPSSEFPDNHTGGGSCIFCLTDVHYALPAQSLARWSHLYIVAGTLLPPLGDWHRPSKIQLPGAPPRGPPLQA